MAKKTGLNKRANFNAALFFKLWLHDKDDTPITVFFAQCFAAGYRFGRQVERAAQLSPIPLNPPRAPQKRSQGRTRNGPGGATTGAVAGPSAGPAAFRVRK
jgi:hypothetical protein